MGATLATVLIQQLFALLQLPFDLAWWTLLLGVNIAATALSQALGRLLPRTGPSAPTFYPLSSFALAIGTLSSLALHLTNVIIKVAAGIDAAQHASVAGYLLFAVFNTGADIAYVLVLSFVTLIAWTSGLGAAHALRDGAYVRNPALTYFVAVLLFVINTLFLQTWTAAPAGGAHSDDIVLAIALAGACALSLASLLYLFGARLLDFVVSVQLATRVERTPWAVYGELGAGIALGIVSAALALLSISAFIFAAITLATGFDQALASLITVLAPLRTWLLAIWPYAACFIIAGSILALLSTSARAPITPAAPVAPAFRLWRLNAPPLWIFAAALAAISALVLVITAGAPAPSFIANLLAYLRGVDEAAAAFALFVLLAQAIALAGLIMLVLGRASATLASGIDGGGLLRALAHFWASAAPLAATWISMLALVLGASLVLAMIFTAVQALWPLLPTSPGTLGLVLGLVAIVLVVAAPVFTARMWTQWRWLKPVIQRWALAAIVALLLLSTAIALSPAYLVLTALASEITPAFADWWNATTSTTLDVLHRLVQSAVIVLASALSLVGGLAIMSAAALASYEVSGRMVRFVGARPRAMAGAAAVLLLLALSPALIAHLRQPIAQPAAPKSAAHGETAAPREQAPSIEALQALIFRDTDFWRFDSINEVSDGAGGYASVADRVVTDASLCRHDALIVASAASSDGPQTYNRTLAQCRALVVAEVLTQRRAAQCGGDAANRVWIMNLGPSRRSFASRADRLVGIVAVGGTTAPVDADYLEGLLLERGSEFEAAIGRSLDEYERGRPEPSDGDVEECRRWFSR